jgi:hypothetical protein
MIVAAANGGRRPRYGLGIAVAALIVAAYALGQNDPTAPAPTPTATVADLQAASPTAEPSPTWASAVPTISAGPFVARFVCPTSGAIGVPVRCQNLSTAGAGTALRYQWLVGPDASSLTAVSSSALFNYAFPVAGRYLIEVRAVVDGQASVAITLLEITIH